MLSPSKLGKENSFDKEIDIKSLTMKSPDKSSKKREYEGLKEICNGNKVDDDFVKDKPLKGVKVPEKQLAKEVKGQEKDEQGLKAKTKRKLHVLEDDCTKEEEKQNVKRDYGKRAAAPVLKNRTRNLHRRELPVEVSLPLGTPLTTVAGVDLPVEAVGDALQFLEFCAAFGKASISFKLICNSAPTCNNFKV